MEDIDAKVDLAQQDMEKAQLMRQRPRVPPILRK